MSRARGGSVLTTVSPMRIVPWLIDSRPASIRSEVVLPQPDGPSSTSISPLATSRLRSSTAITSPKRLPTCSKRHRGRASFAAAADPGQIADHPVTPPTARPRVR